jgi:hypothetical protein
MAQKLNRYRNRKHKISDNQQNLQTLGDEQIKFLITLRQIALFTLSTASARSVLTSLGEFILSDRTESRPRILQT